MRLALCKITRFVLLQIFSEWQPIDSTQQDASLSSWHYGAQAVGQSHNTVSDEMAPKPNPFTFPLPPCLFLSHLLFLLNTPLKLKASLVLRSRCRLKDIFFLLHLSEEMSLLLALVGTGLLQLSSTESRYSMWVPVLNIAILPDTKLPPCIPFFSSSNTKHCHLSCSTVSVKEGEAKQYKSELMPHGCAPPQASQMFYFEKRKL